MAMEKKTCPKKGSMKSKTKGKPRSAKERTDDDIMHTNDSSITSKRCVSKLYFPNEPDFYEPFVPKYMRRNPLINRGYWLRMHAIEQAVLQFLQEDSPKAKVIVNLGCGYDPLPFQFWHRHDELCKHALFIDVDYPQLIGRKRDRMLTNDLLRDALLKTNLHSAQSPVFLRSDQYMALGCDLRDLATLEKLLRAEIDMSSSSIFFVAEVSLTYMPVSDSDLLIQWASTLDDARFCMLEQFLPQGYAHPFASTMLRHFDKLGTHIHAVKPYPLLSQQRSRFENAGWSTFKVARNLWDLWSDDDFTPPTARSGLDAIEPFDEWEEFALFAGHYFLIVASNASIERPIDLSTVEQSNTNAQGHSGIEARPMTITHHATAGLSRPNPRRFGAAFTIGNDTIAFHGGQGLQSRLAGMDVLERNNHPTWAIQPCNSTVPQARICHTVTPLYGAAALLVGGRTSPTHALQDCWLIDKEGLWKQVHDLNPARFRHSSVSVCVETDNSKVPDVVTPNGVLVFGGKATDGTVLDDCMLWTAAQGWTKIPVNGPQRPSPRFGSAISTLGLTQNSGYLVGGMAPSGVVLEDVWEWRMTKPALNNKQHHLEFIDRTNDLQKASPSLAFGRVGASLVPFGNSLLLVGGTPKKEIGSVREEFVLFTPHPVGTTIDVQHPSIDLPESARPLLVGAGVASVSLNEVIIAGGGAVCFSMGSFWNSGYYTIRVDTAEPAQPWTFSASPTAATNEAKATNASPLPKSSKNKQQPKLTKPVKPVIPFGRKPIQVRRIQLSSPSDFSKIITASQPVIIEGQNIGPCRDLWSLDYLREKIGPDREVIIHSTTSDVMNFSGQKNFTYAKTSFSTFIDGIVAGERSYLRSISSTLPTKAPTLLAEDFPEIAQDFQLPPTLEFVKERLHSSPLRISGPVTLWLHYDVLANILCQITCPKTLTLFPPSDVPHLAYPPAASSSPLNLSPSNPSPTPAERAALNKTNPHHAALRPGDILFIPPLWSHMASPDQGTSVAVNVFFRDLEKGYAAGKDVYGNRDLQGYENGRRDVDKILRGFKEVPADMARFYLERLGAEILEKAGRIGVVRSENSESDKSKSEFVPVDASKDEATGEEK